MAVTFLVVPQWQGSSNARAMRLVDGAEAIRGDLPSSHTRVVDVPSSAGRRSWQQRRQAQLHRARPRSARSRRSTASTGRSSRSAVTAARTWSGCRAWPAMTSPSSTSMRTRTSTPPSPASPRPSTGWSCARCSAKDPDELLPEVPLDPQPPRVRRRPGARPRRGCLSRRCRHRHRARPDAGEHRRCRRGHRRILGLPPHRPRRARSRRDLGARVSRAVRDDLSRAGRLHRRAARPLAARRRRASPSSHRRRRRMRCRTFRSSCASSGR